MKNELYSVRDEKVGFSMPFYCSSEQVALRQFIATVRSPQPNFANTFPEDKSLYFIGYFDDQKAQFENVDPKFIAHAMAYVVGQTIQKEEKGDERDDV